ncbi:hypothetical protein NA57DRAFT_71530 [Rhizodiscina lignyota]|uniref:Uncharacterized protein n=1 Tax=Rhizodiscina lignyota TaxID=1504668 RepID=A0A9P4INM2_9PEZI|nr:hypothetical protein NA57DRAFT_71530 [Rhizodiscina lignyota]
MAFRFANSTLSPSTVLDTTPSTADLSSSTPVFHPSTVSLKSLVTASPSSEVPTPSETVAVTHTSSESALPTISNTAAAPTAKINEATLAGIVVGVIAFVWICTSVIFLLWKRKIPKGRRKASPRLEPWEKEDRRHRHASDSLDPWEKHEQNDKSPRMAELAGPEYAAELPNKRGWPTSPVELPGSDVGI